MKRITLQTMRVFEDFSSTKPVGTAFLNYIIKKKGMAYLNLQIKDDRNKYIVREEYQIPISVSGIKKWLQTIEKERGEKIVIKQTQNVWEVKVVEK